MILKADKNNNLPTVIPSVRTHIHGTADRPRLHVFNNRTHIYVQIIDDDKQVTLTSSSPVKIFKSSSDIIAGAKYVGTVIAKSALAKGITEVVFDRGGCIFHGFALKLAEAAREAGLKF